MYSAIPGFAQTQPCIGPADVVFVMDASGSMTATGWKDAVNFVVAFVNTNFRTATIKVSHTNYANDTVIRK